MIKKIWVKNPTDGMPDYIGKIVNNIKIGKLDATFCQSGQSYCAYLKDDCCRLYYEALLKKTYDSHHSTIRLPECQKIAEATKINACHTRCENIYFNDSGAVCIVKNGNKKLRRVSEDKFYKEDYLAHKDCPFLEGKND